MKKTEKDRNEAKQKTYEWMSRFVMPEEEFRRRLKDNIGFDPMIGENEAKWLARHAKESIIAWEAACEYVAESLEVKFHIPDALIPIAASALRDPIKNKPSKSGRDPLETAYRNLCFVTAIFLLKHFGYAAASRNPTTKDKNSACDIVSDASKKLGIRAPFSTIDSVWKNFRQKDALHALVLAAHKNGPNAFIDFIARNHFEGRIIYSRLQHSPLKIPKNIF